MSKGTLVSSVGPYFKGHLVSMINSHNTSTGEVYPDTTAQGGSVRIDTPSLSGSVRIEAESRSEAENCFLDNH